jgi:hypothetical protein
MLHWLLANDGTHAGYIFIGLVAAFMIASVLYFFVFKKKTPSA